MTTYRLTYFNLTGLGEAIRYILHYAGIKFEDRRLSFEEWPKYRPETPMGQMPVLEIDGKKYYQSKSILRYLAKKFGLYGSDEEEAFEIDATADSIDDLRIAMSAWYWEDDPVFKAKLKDIALKKRTFVLAKLEEQVRKNNGYFVGGKLSWTDMLYATYTDYMSAVLEHDLNKDHPELQKLVEKVNKLPRIKEYLAQRPKTMV